MIEFDLDLYSEKAIHQAIKDYKGVAQIIANKDENIIRCYIKGAKYDYFETCHEFDNYVLGMSITMRASV